MTPEILEAILEKKNHPMVLATIIERKGSAPREAGTKMLILGDGTTIGTVGGGALEAKVIKEAQEVVNTGIPKTIHFDMTNSEAEKAGMICGGIAKVFVERI